MGRTMRSCDVRAVVMLFALFAVVLPVASAKSAAAPSAVHLTSDGADGRLGTITDDAFAAIEFFAPWCPHCQNFGPTWETVAGYFNTGEHAAGGVPPTPRVTVFSVDCVAERDLCHAFRVRGYPTVLFGTAAQFKLVRATENAGGLTKLGVKSAVDMLAAIGAVTGGEYALTKETRTAETRAAETRAAETARAESAAAPPDSADGDDPETAPHADLHDIALATVQSWHEMTSPNLLTPRSRDAFLGFTALMARSHPLRLCADGARDVAASFDTLWPIEDGDMHAIRKRLGGIRICGDGLGKLLSGGDPDGKKTKAHALDPDFTLRKTRWRSCAGSVEGKRGYTCGVWMLFHSLAARSAPVSSTGVVSDQSGAVLIDESGAFWFKSVVAWVEHFFPCDECRDHFLAMAGDAVGAFPKVVTRDDAQLWAWKAHNRVNRDLAESEKKGEGTGSGDPAYPKTQWPDANACPACRAPIVGVGENGETIRWDKDATVNFLTRFFHGLGAPRLGLGEDAFGAKKRVAKHRVAKNGVKTTALGSVGVSNKRKKDSLLFFLAACACVLFVAVFALSPKGTAAYVGNLFSPGSARRVLLVVCGGKGNGKSRFRPGGGLTGDGSISGVDRFDKVL